MRRKPPESGPLNFESFRHRVMAVACPAYKAGVNAFCKRPSGYQGPLIGFHGERKKLADNLFIATYGADAGIENTSVTSDDPKGFGWGIWRVTPNSRGEGAGA